MSKPQHKPTEKTRAEIIALRSYGVPIKEVAAYIGIDDKTLYKYYKDELENSAIKANANVGKFLYQAASGQALQTGASHGDCVRAAMFWAKTRMGWKETNVQEYTLYRDWETDRKSTRLNSSHITRSRMPSSA